MKVGDSVGNYRVIARLGRGGHGDVWLAEHVLVGKRVAVKVIGAARAAREEARERFLVEARAVATIDHPQVVPLFDFGVSDGGDLYFTMEHLSGRSLRALLEVEKRLPVARALRVAAQVAGGLAAAHARDVIHRDLKPDNVFLVAEGAGVDRVKVLDFGLARRMDSSFTAEGTLLGTPPYMAPEQCAARRDLDGRADVYALGCLLFELLSGAPPFVGPPAEVMRAHRSRLPPSLPSLPLAIRALLARALAKSRDHRFPTMAAFRDALTDEAGRSADAIPEVDQPIAASARKTIDRPRANANVDGNGDANAGAPTVQSRAPGRGRSIAIGLATLAAIAVASPVGWRLLKKPPPPSVARPAVKPRMLAVRSTPPGATVVVDGVGYGTTPVEIPLERGPGQVALSLAGFAPWRGTVDAGRDTTVDAVLAPLPAPPRPRPPVEKRAPAREKPPRLTDEEGLLPPALTE